MAYLKDLFDRLGKALGITSRVPRAGSGKEPVPPAGSADGPAPGNET